MTIEGYLAEIEARHAVEILYACESGSRAWGFASPDSDYDIRFIFKRPSYSLLENGLESIDLPLEGLLDAGGWDLRKAARLLGKSNGALLEWLFSPIVYRHSPGFLNRWRVTAQEVFSAKNSVDHYRGLAKQMVLGKLHTEQVRAKDYLYALRAILAASWVEAGRGIPPVAFAQLLDLLPGEVAAILPDLLEYKARSDENQRMPRVAVLDEYLGRRLAEAPLDSLPVAGEVAPALESLVRWQLARGRVLQPEEFTLDRVRQRDLLLFDTVAGSHAYGTATPASDQDRRGVFVAPSQFLLGLDSIQQVADERSDHVYYELGRFVEMLLKNNPNALELLAMPEDCIRFQHPLFARLRPELFLSKLCGRTFAEYAMGQIRKARGLNKKIVNPQPEKRKSLLEFCYVAEGQGSEPVLEWLATRGLDPNACGLTAIPHAEGLHGLYHGPYRGLVSPKDPDTLVYSSVPHDARPVTWMYCNHDAFKAHCKAHHEYWSWVALRNEERYQTNALHGRGYDSKNLLHTLRLLEMAGEIATEGLLLIRRPNRDFLLKVRSGNFSYDQIVAMAEDKLAIVQQAFASSSLPDTPNRLAANDALLEIRAGF